MFSERYGYKMCSEVLRRAELGNDGVVALSNCYDYLEQALWDYDHRTNYPSDTFEEMEESIWCYYLNRRISDFRSRSVDTVRLPIQYLISDSNQWYEKFDMIEFSIGALRQISADHKEYNRIVNEFVAMVNSSFVRLRYAYRVVNDIILELSDQLEIDTIENAICQGTSVKTHLLSAMKKLSERPIPDCRNSIKESISAVEALCREITGASTLGGALTQFTKKGFAIPNSIRSGLEKLYAYTNDSRTGIRHSIIEGTELPEYEEAKFMLVICSAFINYIQSKGLRFGETY